MPKLNTIVARLVYIKSSLSYEFAFGSLNDERIHKGCVSQKIYISCRKKIKVLECSDLARFEIKKSAPHAAADFVGDIS